MNKLGMGMDLPICIWVFANLIFFKFVVNNFSWRNFETQNMPQIKSKAET